MRLPVPVAEPTSRHESVTSQVISSGSPSGSLAVALTVMVSPTRPRMAGPVTPVISIVGGAESGRPRSSSQTPRPWVATRSIGPSGRISIPWTEAAGRPSPTGLYVRPPSVER